MSDSARCEGRCAVPLGRETTLDALRVISSRDQTTHRCAFWRRSSRPWPLLPFTITKSSVSVAIAVGLSAATADALHDALACAALGRPPGVKASAKTDGFF